MEDLIVASRSAVISSPDCLQQVNGCYAMPRALVQTLIEVIDACVEGIPFVPTDEANMQLVPLVLWLHSGNACVIFALR